MPDSTLQKVGNIKYLSEYITARKKSSEELNESGKTLRAVYLATRKRKSRRLISG